MEDACNGSFSIGMTPTSSQELVDGVTPLPILPPEMLQHIFQQLRLRELLLCREVCHQWKNAATISARKKSSILPMSFDEFDHIHRHRLAVWDKVTNCLSVDPENFPISGFHIRLSRYFWEDYSSHYKTFFNVISKFATELSFEFRQADDKDKFPSLPKGLRFDGSYQKLKHLYLEISYHLIGANVGRRKNLLGDDDDTDVISPLSSIIENAPKLENITMKILVGPMQTIPVCIEALGIRPKLELLTSLSIDCALDDVDWATLTTIGLKLKTLSIQFGTWSIDTEILREFLASQATTLISLEFTSYDLGGSDDVSVELPCLLHVTQLTISEKFDTLDVPPRKLKFPGFSFNAQLPSLKELDLNEAKNSMAYLLLFATHPATPLESLEKLVIPKSLLEWEIIGMPGLAQLFPNIKKLHLNNTNARTNDITAILENMPGLEEFSISLKDQCADFAVTGLSPEYCLKIKEPPSKSWQLAIAELQLPTAVTMSSLENLKLLRILREKENWTGAPELTEISGYVLKKMKSLKYLDFGVRKFPPVISKDLRDDLEKHGIQIRSQSPRHKRTRSDLPTGDYSSDSNSDQEISGPDFEPESSGSSDTELESSGSDNEPEFQ